MSKITIQNHKLDSKQKFNVLIIDDEPGICALVNSMLSTTSYFEKIHVAYSSTEAIQKINNQSFDLIVLDNKMPRKDGTEIIEQMNQVKFSKKLKIIFMSGALTSDHFMIATQLGVKDIIVKPFTGEKLINTVENVLNIQEKIN